MHSRGFVAYVSDQLRPWSDVAARRMFGAHGIFRDGLMFGLVHDDTLYLRTDGQNVGDFRALGAQPFSYRRNRRTVALDYWAVPGEILDDGERLAAWAEKAYRAARDRAAVRSQRSR